MTDRTDLDELVSAYLDGEATADEVARVEADPALRARAEAMRAVARAVSEPPGVDPARRDEVIAAAMAAAGPVAEADGADELARRRAAKRQQRALTWVAAAAAVLMLIAAPLLIRAGRSESHNRLTSAGPLTSTTAPTAEDGAVQPASGGPGGAPATTLPPATSSADVVPKAASLAPPIGDFASLSALVRAAPGALAGAPAFDAQLPAAACVPSLQAADGQLGTVRKVGSGFVGSDQFLVFDFTLQPSVGSKSRVVVTDAGCHRVASVDH
jgi:hypothetical protein